MTNLPSYDEIARFDGIFLMIAVGFHNFGCLFVEKIQT